MQYAKISQVAHFTPEQVVTNHDLAQILETSDDWIRSRTGIGARRIARQEMTSDLAIEVAKRLLAQAQLSADLLDFIIVATITPDSFMPSTAARVQAAIGASRAFAFDLTAACSGFVFALSTAEKFISSGRYQRGLVIGAETLSKTLDWTDRSTAVLFGDGAGGVLLEASERPHFLAELQRTDGARGAGLTSGLTGLSSPYSVPGANIPQLQMDGRTIFDFAMRDVTQTITEVLDMAELTSDAVDYFLLHQANYRILVKMAQKLKIDLDKFPANMMTYGNTSAASIPILLSECVADGRIKLDGSQTVLMAGFGGGLTWGTLVLTL